MVSTPTIAFREFLPSYRSFDDKPASFLVYFDVVATLDPKPLPEVFRDRHLPSFTNDATVALTQTYSYASLFRRPLRSRSIRPVLSQPPGGQVHVRRRVHVEPPAGELDRQDGVPGPGQPVDGVGELELPAR